MEDVDETLREIAVKVNNTYWSTHGVTWEDTIREMEEEFKIHQPFI